MPIHHKSDAFFAVANSFATIRIKSADTPLIDSAYSGVYLETDLDSSSKFFTLSETNFLSYSPSLMMTLIIALITGISVPGFTDK